jgi:hypothetical protein
MVSGSVTFTFVMTSGTTPITSAMAGGAGGRHDVAVMRVPTALFPGASTRASDSLTIATSGVVEVSPLEKSRPSRISIPMAEKGRSSTAV